MEKNTPTKTINLYSVFITLIAATLLTMLLRECSEPVVSTSDIQKVVDSMNAKEYVANTKIIALEAQAAVKQDSIDKLLTRRHETRIVYRTVQEKVKELVRTETGCDSLRAEVNNLMELADDYQLQTDSIIQNYREIIDYKDSILLKRDNLYRDLKATFTTTADSWQRDVVKIQRLEKRRKRDRYIIGGLGIVAGIFIFKK